MIVRIKGVGVRNVRAAADSSRNRVTRFKTGPQIVRVVYAQRQHTRRQLGHSSRKIISPPAPILARGEMYEFVKKGEHGLVLI